MLSSTITNVSSRSTSRSRKEPVHFDPGAAVAAEVKATAAATAATAAAGNPTAMTMKATVASSSNKNKKRVATVAKEKRKKTAATNATKTVVKKKSAPWTAAEDRRLRLLVEQEQRQQKKNQQGQRAGVSGGIRWIHVAKAYGASRNSKQLRERWLNILDPAVKRGDWTEEETALVIRLQKELGNK